MNNGAFGSPVVNANAANNATPSLTVGQRIYRACTARLFDDANTSVHPRAKTPQTGTVELLGIGGNIVGKGVIDENIKCGMELHAVKLCPSEVAVKVVHVVDGTAWTGELVGEQLQQCLGLVIRWERAHIRAAEPVIATSVESGEGQNFSFQTVVAPQYEFHEEDISLNPSDDSPNTPLQSSSRDGVSPATQESQCSLDNMTCIEGLPVERPRRKYSMQNRRRHEQPLRDRREARSQKVTLNSVAAAKGKGGCKKNCLKEVSEKYILDQRYMAWGQKFNERATWMLQMLNAFYSRTQGVRKDKYNTKLDGVAVCNACYATALGYSQRRFKQLKMSHQVYGKVAAVHGNTCKLRERAQMSAARESFQEFVKEAGCTQPNRQIRKKIDNVVVPLVLLPMNTTKLDVFHYVNEEVKKMVDGNPISLSSFYRMWRTEYPHVQIPPFSRFAKCYHCWEYKCGMEATTNAAAKVEIKKLYMVHIRRQMEERRDYWTFKRSAIITPDVYMSIIVDGMDQNTTMVPKMRQTVKNIESRFVKTHLCGVLVHGIGLYADVWIDAHHKHDSNQVVTTVMHVINDVKRRKGRVPPTLRIQADNCTRENKNVYMFALCASLVGLGIFQEVQLCFLIVGHTHEDIDQRFSIISNTLKRTDIDSLQELLQLVEKGTSYTEAFVSARHLENVWDWKSFITPHLQTGGDTLTGITFPHHMRFYMENGMPRVQHKHFSGDAWGPVDGHMCLRSLPSTSQTPELAEVFAADDRELRALQEFIAYKERCVSRLQYVEKNLRAIDEAKWLMQYLIEFPTKDRREERSIPFWPSEGRESVIENAQPEELLQSGQNLNAIIRSTDLILSTMPDPEGRGYFGPRRGRPSTVSVRRTPNQNRDVGIGQTSTRMHTSGTEDPFPPFDPTSDIKVGQFVALTVEHSEVQAGVPFYVGKVLEFGQRSRALKMKVLWYWPIMRVGMQRLQGSNRERYANCMEATWEPSGERHGWVDKEAAIFAWDDVPIRTRTTSESSYNIPIHGVMTETRIRIPIHAKPHMIEYIALQLEEMDNIRLQNDIDAY